jgi:hypothetical protein
MISLIFGLVCLVTGFFIGWIDGRKRLVREFLEIAEAVDHNDPPFQKSISTRYLK